MLPNSAEQRHLDELLAAMRGACDEKFDPGGFLNESFAREFRTTLLVYHYFIRAPLETSAFEAAFIRAARAASYTVKPAREGGRFWDVEVDGRKISLKTTAAAKISPNSLHISKLCEAAWIQDMRSAAQREENTKALFKDYVASVDSIIQFRLFRQRAYYEMVEIPTSLLAKVDDAPRASFAADGPSIGIPLGQTPPDFVVTLDRSDAKVTIKQIRKAVCTVLGEWQLEKPAEAVTAAED